MTVIPAQTGVEDGRGGIRIFFRWQPVEDARAVAVIIHGFADHSGRYGHVFEALAAAGIATLAIDKRGHGRSTGRRGFINRYEEYVDDVETALNLAEARADGKPLFLLGHSLGGLSVSRYLIDRGGRRLKGAVLSSPALGVALAVPAWKDTLGQVMSKVWPSLAIPAGIEAHQVSRDKDIVAAYAADPLVFTSATARWYTETLASQAWVHARAQTIETPMLVLQAGEDSLVDPEATARFHGNLASDDKAFIRYDGLYHEVMNEPERAQVLGDVIAWITDRS
jgi:alpha-beta hydrolase superfamily lysophospholipase